MTQEEHYEKLKVFFQEAMDVAFDGCNWDGCEIQDKAEALGLGHYEDFDTEKHEALGSFEGDSGDAIFILDRPEVGAA